MKPSRGPKAVKDALVEAALDLFAAQGDASVRKVAQRAGVNHGLVHHYLGGKSGLRSAVLERLRGGIYRELDGPESPRELADRVLRLTEADPRYVKLLARALLDGDLPERLQSTFPVVERLREAAGSSDPQAVRASLAEGLALGFGMLVFGPWIRAALDLEAAELDELRDAALDRIFDRLEHVPPSQESPR